MCISHEGRRLELLKSNTNNQKQSFSKFKEKKRTVVNVSLQEFFHYFQQIAGTEGECNIEGDLPNVNGDCVFDELDNEIEVDEIKTAIKNLKRGKSHGEDGILNEYIIEFADILVPLFHKLFNCILDDLGLVPK